MSVRSLRTTTGETESSTREPLSLDRVQCFKDSLRAIGIRNESRQFMTRNTAYISVAAQRKWWGTLDHNANFLYLLKLNDENIGYALIRTCPEPWITGALCSSQRGKGYGRVLFELILDEVRRLSCTHVFLEVRMDNSRAIALYQSLGFESIRDKGNVMTMEKRLE
jgi:ribosomal protein S18 acetylase RimI-like enzyme